MVIFKCYYFDSVASYQPVELGLNPIYKFAITRLISVNLCKNHLGISTVALFFPVNSIF